MILVCGEALVDLVPVSASAEPTYVARAGGSPFNVAVGLGRLEAPVGFLGRLSRDGLGRLLRRRLEADGVDCRLVVEGDEPSTIAIVDLERGAEPAYTFHGEGTADGLLRIEDLPMALPVEVSALHFGSISLVREPGATAYEALMRREHGQRLLSLDPNVRAGLVGERQAYLARLESWVSITDLVKVSQADLEWLYPGRAPGEVAAAWLSRGPAVVVVTRGSAGAVALGAGVRVEVPGTPVAVVDTVGAGDSFTSALLAWLASAGRLDRTRIGGISAQELRTALAFADAAAAITCTRAGAQPPTLAELRFTGAP